MNSSRVAKENIQLLELIKWSWVALLCKRLYTISKKVLTLLGSLGSANNLAENDRRGELKPRAKIWPFSEHYFDFQSFSNVYCFLRPTRKLAKIHGKLGGGGDFNQQDMYLDIHRTLGSCRDTNVNSDDS